MILFFLVHLQIKIILLLTLRYFSGNRLPMKSIDEQILRTTKEIVVKFIEMGRLSPSNVHESFRDIYATISETIREADTDKVFKNEKK